MCIEIRHIEHPILQRFVDLKRSQVDCMMTAKKATIWFPAEEASLNSWRTPYTSIHRSFGDCVQHNPSNQS